MAGKERLKKEQLDWFGVDTTNQSPVKLINRLWSDLVVKLLPMKVERDDKDLEVYNFYHNEEKFVSIRVASREDNEGSYTLIELLGKDGKSKLSHMLFPVPVGIDKETMAHDPTVEIVDIVKSVHEENPELSKARILAEFIGI